MKKVLCTLILFTVLLSTICAFGSKDSEKNEIIVYTYDSFVSDWGAGNEIAKRFEEKTGKKVSFIAVGDGAQLLSRAILEKDAPYADVLLGIDNNQVELVKESNLIEAYKPKGVEHLNPQVVLSEDWLLTPYDWGYFAFVYDTESSIKAPVSLKDLIKPEYKNTIVLMDPRTSSPGLGFAAWTLAAFGDDCLEYWTSLKENVLTMAPSWSTGYGLFTSGEAPLVISYTTSPSYHVEYDKTNRYKALIFPEGHIMQIEGVGLLKNAPNKDGAKEFIDFIVSKEAQEVLPLTQWMYPINKDVVLPDCYDAAPKAKKTLHVDDKDLSKTISAIMNTVSN